MKKDSIILLVMTLLLSCRKPESVDLSFYDCSMNFTDSSQQHRNNNNYQHVLNDMTDNGVVGVMMSVYDTKHGIWVGASGKADLYNNIDMKPCNMTRAGSTMKMFTSAIVLKLQEEGKINLDERVSRYLQGHNINKIKNAETATVRQLLQHSSGIYNYIQNLQFQTATLNNLTQEWGADDLLKYAYNSGG